MKKIGQITITDALIEVSQAISAGTNLVSFLGLVKDLAVRIIDAERASIFLLDKSNEELWTLIADGEKMIRLPSRKGIVGEVISKNKKLNIPDAASDSRFFDGIDKKTGYVTKSILCVPMRNREGRALGALEILNKKDGIFTREDEKFLSIFGTQAGLAIENVEMYEDIQDNLKQLKLLYNVQQNINASMDYEQIFEVILSELIPSVGGESGVVYFISFDGREIYFAYKPENGLVCWESGSSEPCPVFLKELVNAVKLVLNKNEERHFIHLPNLVYSELKRGEQTIGYFAVHLSQEDTRLFNSRPLEYLKVIAAQTVSFIEKKEALDQKKRSEKQALIGSMLSTIVHDMKSPLSGISGYTQLIRQRSSEEEIKKFCNTIMDVLDRINNMNNELLSFVRGDSVILNKSRISLSALFDKILADNSEKFKNAKIHISKGFDQEIIINADEGRLIRVFNNIIVNASEAMPDGGAIEISALMKKGDAEIRIKDSGVGIPSNMVSRIFEPFITSGKKNGTGLGLSICRSIIEEHGGNISVKSSPGKGSVFTIKLPVGHMEEI